MKYFLSLIFFSGLQLACTSPQHDQDPDTIAVKPADTLFSEEVIPIKPPVQKDTLLDNLARFIAGLPQLDSNSFTALETDAYWEQFKISMDFNWEKMYKNRLGKIEHWQDSVFAPLQNDSLVLFYPFSGPDFLHAYYLYPDAPVYVLAALEPIIEVPALDTVRVPKRDHFLDSLGRSLRDIFQKSYFITNHMQKDLKAISGVLPPLYFFLERTGHELLRQQYITLDSAGQESIAEYKKLHWQTTQGVKLIFRNLESKKVKTLYYFSASISNGGLRDRPEFVRFISEQAPFNTFVKSASYLLHNSQFTEIKDIILTHSDNIFQDDTGIPFKDFKKQLNRTVHLFGTYTKPIKDFGEVRYQPDLDSAYKVSANRTPLPFSLGYHWGTAQQHYMLVRKTRMDTR